MKLSHTNAIEAVARMIIHLAEVLPLPRVARVVFVCLALIAARRLLIYC
jgi:hypothetical protein